MARSPVEGEVESRLKQEVQELRSRVEELARELEEDKLMLACKQRKIEELTAKCTDEEKQRRKAEVLMERSDEARIKAEEARRITEEACRLAEEGRKKAEEDWRQSENGKKKAEERRRRAEEGRRKAEDYLHDAQLQKNQVESELEHYRQCGAPAADGMWQQGKLDTGCSSCIVHEFTVFFHVLR